jgi:bifunctional DNase/RNase
MKDRISAHEFTLFLLNSAKVEVSRIRMVVEEDGTFWVNGEPRGKF